MFSQPNAGGYDRVITVFSPEGRLYQVEYAIEAIRRGTPAVGIKNEEGVVFCVERRDLDLQENIGSEKLFKIDNHIGIAIAGLTADARTLIDQARTTAQVNYYSYSEPISIIDCTKDLCDKMQLYTQNAGVRPFGISLLVGGIDPDDGPKLFLTDPSGSYWSYFGTAIGNNSSEIRDYLELKYSKDMSLEEIKKLCLESLLEAIDKENVDEGNFEMSVITIDKDYYELTPDEKKQLLESL